MATAHDYASARARREQARVERDCAVAAGWAPPDDLVAGARQLGMARL